jgi:hypothetical protein
VDERTRQIGLLLSGGLAIGFAVALAVRWAEPSSTRPDSQVAELGLRVSQADVARDAAPLEASRCPEVWIYFGDEAGIRSDHRSGTT